MVSILVLLDDGHRAQFKNIDVPDWVGFQSLFFWMMVIGVIAGIGMCYNENVANPCSSG